MFNPGRGHIVREIALVTSWFIIGLLALTLTTYTPSDPSWSVSVSGEDTQNWGGVVGAHAADVLLSLLGYSAYLLCLIAVIAIHAILRRPIKTADGRLSWHWCVLGVLLFILSSAALENLRFDYAVVDKEPYLPSGAGGYIGHFVAQTMQSVLGKIGAAILLICIWMISLSLAVALSWFEFFEMVGEGVERALCAVAGAVKNAANRLAQRHAARQQARWQRAASAATAQEPIPSVSVQTRRSSPGRKLRTPDRREPPAAKSAPLWEKNESGNLPSLPPPSLLDTYVEDGNVVADEVLAHNGALIEKTLASFGVKVSVLSFHPGPVITRYDIRPDTGVKGAQIVSLVRDIARALSVSGVRVLETIPGKDCMGLEIPNAKRATVYFAELVADDSYTKGMHNLPLTLGKDAAGKPLVSDLTKMPHLLIAGATGSGKSVCVNALLLSLLFAASPEKLRLILIDPKMLELASYHDIPHLLAPVVTDVNLAPAALNWAVEEMENRYRKMSTSGARNIVSYNDKVAAGELTEEDGTPAKPLPYIVIVIDELADLMMVIGKKIEITISRLAQKARAAGIHLILATQRPSVDVITGLIKANVPCRIAFQVASKVDSRTIIDQMGADMLLGMGDMLYLPAGAPTPIRVHGAFVSDDEVRRVAEHLRASGKCDYAVDFSGTEGVDKLGFILPGGNGGEEDEMYDQAVEAVLSSNRPSISLVQRKLRIGYNRAARLIENMEKVGLVSAADDTGVRKILAPRREE